MKLFFKKRLFLFVLGCLVTQPAVFCLAEARISIPLASPLRKNFTDAAPYWLENYAQATLNPTNEQVWFAEAQKNLLNLMLNGPQETIPVSPRIELLRELQALNTPEKKSILKGIDKTQTLSGRIALYNFIAQEQQPWEVVHNRQNFIKLLVENPALLQRIRGHVANIVPHERIFVEGISISNRIIEEDQESLKNMARDENGALLALIMLAVNGACKRNDFFQLCKIQSINAFIMGTILVQVAIFLGALKTFSDEREPGLLLGALGALATTALSSFILKWINSSRRSHFEAARGIAQTYRNTENLMLLVQTPLTQHYYNNLFPYASSAWSNFTGKAHTSTFNTDNSFSYLFTHHGRVLNLFYRIPDIMSELGTILRFYGELDAYSAIAQFVVDQQQAKNNYGEPVTVCFAEFLSSTDSILHTKNFWHPIIEKDIVRPSTLYLGGEDNPRDMIVTGPNAGGKSVILKALLTNIVLAQTFGIACAESWAFTPFTKVIARLKGVDDTASDKSKFMLEAIGMSNLLKEMLLLKPDEHAFVVTDELFTGTEVGPAISLSIELCSQIGKIKNVMYVLATHYKQICDLKRISGNTFDNYKVSVFKDKENRKLIYPFSLSQGIGNTNVAFDIFLEQLEKDNINDPVLINVINKAKERQEAIEKQLEHIDEISLSATTHHDN